MTALLACWCKTAWNAFISGKSGSWLIARSQFWIAQAYSVHCGNNITIMWNVLFTANKPCCQHSVVFFFKSRSRRRNVCFCHSVCTPALTASCKTSKANVFWAHNRKLFEWVPTPFYATFVGCTAGLPLHVTLVHQWHMGDLDSSSVSLPTQGVNLHIVVEPFCRGYRIHAAHLSLNLSLLAWNHKMPLWVQKTF